MRVMGWIFTIILVLGSIVLILYACAPTKQATMRASTPLLRDPGSDDISCEQVYASAEVFVEGKRTVDDFGMRSQYGLPWLHITVTDKRPDMFIPDRYGGCAGWIPEPLVDWLP